jgi:hypothetical protein
MKNTSRSLKSYGWFEASNFMKDEYADPSIEGWRVPLAELTPSTPLYNFEM